MFLSCFSSSRFWHVDMSIVLFQLLFLGQKLGGGDAFFFKSFVVEIPKCANVCFFWMCKIKSKAHLTLQGFSVAVRNRKKKLRNRIAMSMCSFVLVVWYFIELWCSGVSGTSGACTQEETERKSLHPTASADVIAVSSHLLLLGCFAVSVAWLRATSVCVWFLRQAVVLCRLAWLTIWGTCSCVLPHVFNLKEENSSKGVL